MTDQRAATIFLASCLFLILGGIAVREIDSRLRWRAARRRANRRGGYIRGR